ncbi:hypothetical protein O9992_15320 [Vibrio lentus]|nr:hypothetical protein [Vibrio lentus]
MVPNCEYSDDLSQNSGKGTNLLSRQIVRGSTQRYCDAFWLIVFGGNYPPVFIAWDSNSHVSNASIEPCDDNTEEMLKVTC